MSIPPTTRPIDLDARKAAAVTSDTTLEELLTELDRQEQTIDEVRAAAVGRIGENIVVRRWDALEAAGESLVHSYVHMGGKVGVLVALQTQAAGAVAKPEFTKYIDDRAMQAAAMSPLWLA